MTERRSEEGDTIETPALPTGAAGESPEIWLEVRPLVPPERAARFIAFLLRAAPGAELRLGGHEGDRYRFHVAAPSSAIIAALLDATEFVPISLRQPALDELQISLESVPGGPDGDHSARPAVEAREESRVPVSPSPPQGTGEWQPTWRSADASPVSEEAAADAEADTELLPPLVEALEHLDSAIGELYEQLSADTVISSPPVAEPVWLSADAGEAVEEDAAPPLHEPLASELEGSGEQARDLSHALRAEEEPEETAADRAAVATEPEPEAATLAETAADRAADATEPEPEAATVVETAADRAADATELEPEAATLVEAATASLSSVFALDEPKAAEAEEAEPGEAEERYHIVLGDSCPVCRAVSRISFSAERPPRLPIAGCRETGGCRCTLPQFDASGSKTLSGEAVRQAGDAAGEVKAEEDGKPLAFRGQIQVVAHPFANFGRLNQFITVVGGLPGVRTVTLRRFRNGILRLAVDYTGATPLSTHLKLALGESANILSDSGELIEIAVPEQEQDQERSMELMTVAARGSKTQRPASA